MKELKGANMDVDLIPAYVQWEQDKYPCNEVEKTNEHKCAVKIHPYANISRELKILI